MPEPGTYSWDGNGVVGNDSRATFSNPQPGKYPVTVTYETANDAIDEASLEMTVKPRVAISTSAKYVPVGESAVLTATGTPYGGDYTWVGVKGNEHIAVFLESVVGKYEVNATYTLNGIPESATCEQVVVGVDEIRCHLPDGRTISTKDTLVPYALVGETLNFEPVPTPGDAQWPENQPRWRDDAPDQKGGWASVAFSSPGTYKITAECGYSSVSMTVIVGEIVVEWCRDPWGEDLITEANDHPVAPVGLKYYPDALTLYGDPHQVVYARVRVSPAQETEVHLRLFDPDDPSADGGALDPNGRNGGDNRQKVRDQEETVTTYSSGQAVVAFSVSLQPGDNFKVAASISKSQLGKLDNNNVRPDDSVPSVFNGGVSPLLTIWREIRIETESMKRPGLDDNTMKGRYSNPTNYDPAHPTQYRITVTTTQLTNDNEFDYGFIGLGADEKKNVFRVYDYDDEWPFRSTVDLVDIRLRNGWPFPDSDTYIMCDDDVDQKSWQAGLGCRAELIDGWALLLPKVDAKLGALFAPAYISARLHSASAGSLPFEKNSALGRVLDPEWYGTMWDNYASSGMRSLHYSTEGTWSVSVIGAFQPYESEDGDPESSVTAGAAPHRVGSKVSWWEKRRFTGMCAIFWESLRESDRGLTISERYIAHEIAHTFGLPHANNCIMGEFIRGEKFAPGSLDKLRSYVPPDM